MNTTSVKVQSLWRVSAIDALLLTVACLVPTVSHLLAWPLYQLNPMLLVLLAGMLLVRDRRNAYLLAVLLPVVSMLAVGMPTPLKAVCMVAEYASVVFVSGLLQGWDKRFVGTLGAMLVAMLAGKVVYYLLKALLLAPAVLISTSVALQLAVVAVAATVYAGVKFIIKN
jgi:hypothetical protein